MIRGIALVALLATTASAFADPPSRRPLYYQAPDGAPFWSAGPRRSADGREWRPVYDDPPAAREAAPARPAKPGGGEHRILYYRNPMGLADTSAVPKKDSMGMDYVPVYADEGGDGPGIVRIAPGRLQTLGVRTETVALGAPVVRVVRATGILQYDERGLATVTTRAAGWIEHLAVAATGDPVRRGQVLAEIYAPDIVASEQEYLVATGLGGELAASAAERLRALDVPADEIDRLRRTRRAARLVAVRAPADGVVIDKPAQLGVRVAPGDPLYRTANVADIWLIAEVQEQDLGGLSPGRPAQVGFVAFPGRRFTGRVDFIYPDLNAATRTGRVRIVLPNPDRVLRAAMYASVQIDTDAGGAPELSVPNAAVIDSGRRQIVLVALGGGRFAPRAVHLGRQSEDRVQVLGGLKPGERVVVGANFLIDAESNLRAALQGFAAGAHDPKGRDTPSAETPAGGGGAQP